jgi:ribose transport system substrate-binding protein
VAGAALAVGGPLLAACSSSSSTASTPASSGGAAAVTGNRRKIGFSQPDTSAAVWQLLMQGAQQECQKRGYTLLESHANAQLSAQVSEIQTWIGEGVGAIVCLPLDNNAIIPLISQAHAKGVKFLDYSDDALPGVDGWVIFDNLQGAKLVGDYAGNWVNKTLGGQAKVGLLTHQIQLTGKQRIEGAVAALQATAPGAKVVAQHEGVLSPDTFPAFQSMLQAHPDINVVICIADEGCDGVYQAFMATHPSQDRINKTLIAGFDGSVPTIKAIETGGPIRVTGVLDTIAIGAACIEAAANAIEGTGSPKINFQYALADPQTTALNAKIIAEG